MNTYGHKIMTKYGYKTMNRYGYKIIIKVQKMKRFNNP